ncbi:MAG: CooT family nickel-binding protein, partial [Erysipelotrichaceae bacterium]|nr:CooT family nickel-binding protein [Erysipelotrichaceae bacterium]
MKLQLHMKKETQSWKKLCTRWKKSRIMCLSKAFIIEDNEKKVLCDRVKTMSSEDGKIILKDLFDDVWEIEGQ